MPNPMESITDNAQQNNQQNNQQTQNNQIDNQNNQSIINRVANFKAEEAKKSNQSEEVSFDPKMFDNISSAEEAKKVAESAYKSFERGFQKKFQDLSELKKTLESKVNESSSWTTEKVQSLLQDQSFVSAAQGMLGTSDNYDNSDEYSSLSESEKRKIAAIEKQNQTLLQQQNLLLMKQQDEMLKQKFPNYKSEAVDTITAELLQGKVKNTREYIWKAYDYENAIDKAYQLGQQDTQKTINENAQVASFSGIETAHNSSEVKREKGESNENLLKRLYSNAIRGRRAT